MTAASVDYHPQRCVVLNVVALCPSLISAELTPNLHLFFSSPLLPTSSSSKLIETSISTISPPPFPALTCVSQSTYLTGQPSSAHGITANGFYDRESASVRNWHQSRAQVRGDRLFDVIKARDPNITIFSNCWWNSMYDDSIDYMISPRPQYCSDGRKFPDSYTKPASLRDHLQGRLGKFPLHRFWGPLAGIQSSRWIADASMIVDDMHRPNLSLIYLPHLDYVLQRCGPNDTSGELQQALRDIDNVVGDLIDFYRDSKGANVIILSEYGITEVDTPVYINRMLRAHGFIQVREERGGETLDYGASRAFAYTDHQVAHVYVRHRSDIDDVRRLLEETSGIERVLEPNDGDEYAREAFDDGNRSGDLIAVAESRAWFAYYFWNDDSMAPDFARTINIHEKPGYDPCEMLLAYQPKVLGVAYAFVKFVMSTFLRLRVLIDATPIDEHAARSIKGSHGRMTYDIMYHPVIGSSQRGRIKPGERIPPKSVFALLMKQLFNQPDADEGA